MCHQCRREIKAPCRVRLTVRTALHITSLSRFHLEPSILLVEVQHDSRLILPTILTSLQCRGDSVRRVHSPRLVLTGGQVSNAWTCVSNAASSSSGKAFPLLSARLMIPAQAFALKKYRGGTSPVSSVDDKEHTFASLGHTEELSVQHSPCTPPIRPEFGHGFKERPESPSAFSRQHSGHVLPDDPFRINLCASSEIFEHELAAWIVQSLPESGDAECLAGASSHNDICRIVVLFPVNFGHIS